MEDNNIQTVFGAGIMIKMADGEAGGIDGKRIGKRLTTGDQKADGAGSNR